jgi:hypothetical protein
MFMLELEVNLRAISVTQTESLCSDNGDVVDPTRATSCIALVRFTANDLAEVEER